MNAIEDVKAHLTKEIKRAETTLKSHAETLAKSPMHAMEWADAAFSSAARLDAAQTALRHLETTTGALESLKAIATRYALLGARHPARSTSACSNIMAQEKASAWAEIVEILQD